MLKPKPEYSDFNCELCLMSIHNMVHCVCSYLGVGDMPVI